jgi:hypothetical protein
MAQLISILQAVNDASMEIGIMQRPSQQALASLDEDIVQMTALLTAVADELLLDDPYRDVLGDGNWLVGLDNTRRARPLYDTDLLLVDGRLMVNGLKFTFLQAKGLEFGEQLRAFTNRLNKVAARANQRVLDLDIDGSRVL